MPRILAVGIATLDVVNRVSSYPQEDDELRALSQRMARGGNATNTLVALSQLGHECSWAGALADDANSRIILDDLSHYSVATEYCERHKEGVTPTSYITLSAESGSRTIVHYRDLPEYSEKSFSLIPLADFDWIHFEGRAPQVLKEMLPLVKAANVPCSLEVEKPRDGIEALFNFPDLLLFSRHYVCSMGYELPDLFLRDIVPTGKVAYCAWGDEGAWVKDVSGDLHHCPAFKPERVVDTLAAGDVFNAGIIHAAVSGFSEQDSVRRACHFAGGKCGRLGLDGLSELADSFGGG